MMRYFYALQGIGPDGRHRMVYHLDTNAGLYEIQFNEVFEYSHSSADLPDGILTGARPTLINRIGGCYEIAFDLISNIDNGTPFERPPGSSDSLSTIIAQCITTHYNTHKPYCYCFTANDFLLMRAYRMAIRAFSSSNPNIIKRVHLKLEPGGRGYAIEF